MQQNQLPDVVQQFIAESPRYRGKTVKIDTTPYWSTVRFQFTLAGVLAISSRQAFSYAIGGLRQLAGFTADPAGTLATMADTNLQKPGETRLNADIFVGGVSCYVTPDSDAALVRRVMRECAVTISTDGQNTYPFAPLEKIPAGGGLQGVGFSAIKLPAENQSGYAVDGGEGAQIAFFNNGNAMSGNFLELFSPVLWTGQQGTDSNFRLNFDIARQITEAVAPLRAAGAGIGGYNPPAALGDIGTYVDVRVSLMNWAISLPSING